MYNLRSYIILRVLFKSEILSVFLSVVELWVLGYTPHLKLLSIVKLCVALVKVHMMCEVIVTIFQYFFLRKW